MASLLPRLAHFNGGLKLDTHKSESTQRPISVAPVPERLILPLHQHIGTSASPLVGPGDRVLKGQQIAKAQGYISAAIHASSSGTVTGIEEHAVPHPSGLSAACIVIETDGEDRWHPQIQPLENWEDTDPAQLRDHVRNAGIVGLGGAGFPAYIKMNPVGRSEIDLLILNAAECEPYISCDEMLCREQAERVFSGAEIIRHALHARQCVIAIEDNMPLAIEILEKAAQQLGSDIKIIRIPAIYPAGGERQLIKILTGEEVPSGGLPIDIGVVCHNVGTAAAVHDAVTAGHPLISRIITVTGDGIANPGNVEARIGTPVRQLVEHCGGYMPKASNLVMGGPMMGFTLESDNVPAIKTTNCLLSNLEPVTEKQPERHCIRCGDCATVCPANLLPQHLYWHARDRDLDNAQEFNLFDCIECGCCAYVCPSHIPLVEYYRFAKSEIWAREKDKEKSDHARQRHEMREQRIAREKEQRARRLEEKRRALKNRDKNTDDPKKAAIEAALARVAAKKAAGNAGTEGSD